MSYSTIRQKSGGEVGHQEPVSLRIPSSSEYALLSRLVVSSVGEAARFGPGDIYDLKLAVTEAVTNVIRHAAVDSMLLEYRSLPGVVEVSVVDTGRGFNAEEIEGEPGEHGGFGLTVIRNLANDMDLDSNGEGTTVRITRYAADPVS